MKSGWHSFLSLPSLSIEMEEITLGPLSFHRESDCTLVFAHPALKNREEALLDSLACMYFSSLCKELFHLGDLFAKSSFDFDEKRRVFVVKEIDLPILHALSHLLNEIYLAEDKSEKKIDENEKRLVRSIRYFIHAITDPLSVLNPKTHSVDTAIFDPEELLFLETSFEVLFNISREQPSPDLKQKLRPLLKMHFGKPLEMVWKWTDGFYKLCRTIVHEGKSENDLFLENESFVYSYTHLAIKLFIYSAILLLKKTEESISLEGFPLREDVHALLWSEELLLKKIALLLMQVKTTEKNEALLLDLEELTHIYLVFLHYYHKPLQSPTSVQFIPTAKEKLLPAVDAILLHSQDSCQKAGRIVPLQELLPPRFCEKLQKRVA